ncbi:ribosome maturation factor RimM [Rhizobium sp. CC-YZS058]|uniref:ribosome maturation factor RimM n=1 Tax=Rhizobium sp. CC-YZS058 TaxID=3042153 RepID=UPI002B05DA94|nr:ribosome maturation factor RimM [Rhizobium sp. CC-YZS058]MEA3536598.1 ribosome maturation factor RimM [Rhizobium sp. CC-YZS058]
MSAGPLHLKNPVLMGTIGAAQGLRGEVRVKSFAAEPEAIGDYGHLYGADGRVFEVLEVRTSKTVVIVRFRGINDRTAAEALNGLDLFIERENLPDDDLDEDEFFYADLEGLEARDTEGKSYGTVTGVFDFGAGDLLELKGPGRRPVLIPFTEWSVLEIDLEGGTLLVDPLAAGLVEDKDENPFSANGTGKAGKPGKRPKPDQA